MPVLVFLAAVFLAPAAVAADRAQVLRAIHQVENPTNVTRPGLHGELGSYQFRRGTWKMHTNEPFSRANEPALADEVAAIHYEWIKRGLIRAGLEPSVFNIAMAWNGGLSAVISRRAPASSHRYATRVANLVTEAERRPIVAAAP